MIVAEGIFFIAVLLIMYTYVLYPILLKFQIPSMGESEKKENVTVSIVTLLEKEKVGRGVNNIREFFDVENSIAYKNIKVVTNLTEEQWETIDIDGEKVEAYYYTDRYNDVLNTIIKNEKNEVILFWNSCLKLEKDILKTIQGIFEDENVVCVSGNRKKVDINNNQIPIGTYTKYENFVRNRESGLGMLSVVDSGIYAFRRTNIEEEKLSSAIIDVHLYITTLLLLQGQKIILDNRVSVEERVENEKENNIKSHIKSAAASYQNVALNIKKIKFNKQTGIFISHRVLKLLCPILLIEILLLNFVLAFHSGIWLVMFLLQVSIYMFCLIKNVAHIKLDGVIGKVLNILCYFIEINIADLLGMIQLACHKEGKV